MRIAGITSWSSSRRRRTTFSMQSIGYSSPCLISRNRICNDANRIALAEWCKNPTLQRLHDVRQSGVARHRVQQLRQLRLTPNISLQLAFPPVATPRRSRAAGSGGTPPQRASPPVPRRPTSRTSPMSETPATKRRRRARGGRRERFGRWREDECEDNK